MAKTRVSPKPARKKDAAKTTPPPLTLDKIAIAWEEGSQGPRPRTHYVTGATLARLVHTIRHRNPYVAGHDALAGDAWRTPMMLRGLSYLVFPDPGTPHEDLDKDVRFTLSELLSDLGAVATIEQTTTEAKEYRVHVGPIPAEWTK